MADHRTLSYSAWKTWDQCAQKYKFSYIEKLPRGPAGPAAARGTEIHKTIDDYLAGKTEEVHPEVSPAHGQWLMQMRELPHEKKPELKFAVSPDWEICDFRDPEAQWRGVIDLHLPLLEGEDIVDTYEWKTGKIYDDHAYQASLYGTIALVLEENALMARVTNVYLDQGKSVPREYLRSDHEGMKFMWSQRYKDVMRDDLLPPNPGWYCRYCDYSRQKNGPCSF